MCALVTGVQTCALPISDDLHGAAVELDGEVDGAALAEQLADFSVALAERHRRHGLRFLAFLGDRRAGHVDRKSDVWGQSVSVRVDIGGRRNINKKNRQTI